jgi:iron complex transport system ATP-binding protein
MAARSTGGGFADAEVASRKSEVGSLKSEAFSNRPFLQLSGASVVLGGALVLDNLTLSIDVGEHAAILGPNGAGKSTFMKLLTLQQYPLAGDDEATAIRLFGRDRWDVFALRSQMGIVSADLHDRFVHGNSNGVLTGLETVASGFFATHGLFAHQQVSDAMRARALEALDRVGAAALAHRTLDTMSTGEARRALIARALVHDPKVLVLDEPTRGLDLVARHVFMERIRDVARQGVTILLVTHYVDEVIPEIERVILLEGGRIAADGSKAAVLTSEALARVFKAQLAVEETSGYYHARVVGEF